MAKTSPFTDGEIHLATCSSEILRDLFCAMHGVPTPDGQVPSEHALRLYNSVSDELVARIALDAKARSEKPDLGWYHDGKKWLIIFSGGNMEPRFQIPLIHEGTMEEAKAAANDHSIRYDAERYVVLPYLVGAEGSR